MAAKSPSPQRQAGVPATPRVIAATPTPSGGAGGQDAVDGYFGPVTRSVARRRVKSPPPIDEADMNGAIPDTARARASETDTRLRRLGGLFRSSSESASAAGSSSAANERLGRKDKETKMAIANGKAVNGHLSPTTGGGGGGAWRDFSRSPSPLGLIPIHRHWRSFVHRHEIPRKILHVSIGFVTIWLYTSGVRAATMTPYILYGLIPIFSMDLLRHRLPGLNRAYIRVWGALMRESEVDSFNGVIWYLVGAYVVLRFFPKDVGVMGVLLLSWCDTAASTVGRAYGRYTARIRRGKSLAGSLAACAVGALTALAFWGWLGPRINPLLDDPDGQFMFTGTLSLPEVVKQAIATLAPRSSTTTASKSPMDIVQGTAPWTVTGPAALAIMSLWTGFVGAASEVVDLWGWDDNMTIPILSGIGIWGFLKVFGA